MHNGVDSILDNHKDNVIPYLGLMIRRWIWDIHLNGNYKSHGRICIPAYYSLLNDFRIEIKYTFRKLLGPKWELKINFNSLGTATFLQELWFKTKYIFSNADTQCFTRTCSYELEFECLARICNCTMHIIIERNIADVFHATLDLTGIQSCK